MSMPDPLIPGAVDLPHLAHDETAFGWDPSDLYATGWLMGLLSSRDHDWRLQGLGDAAWLVITERNGRGQMVAMPGDFVILGDAGTARTLARDAGETARGA